jgi:NosR/NirI family transcriptional regulator, nitrous oxide reductase regulator
LHWHPAIAAALLALAPAAAAEEPAASAPAAIPAAAARGPAGTEAYGHSARAGSLDCTRDPCGLVLPGATTFAPVEGRPYQVGLDARGETVGWVALSDDLTDVKGYSGKPLSTVVGLSTDGTITGGRVVHHSEPILLVGIPEQELHDFVDAYRGVRADEKVVVGRATGGARAVDIVSGATVTVLAENQTILDTARALAQDVGAIPRVEPVPGHFVAEDAVWSWDRIVRSGAFGRLQVSAEQMGADGAGYQDKQGEGQLFIDLWFTLADAPQIGRALLGTHEYQTQMARLRPGEHLFVVLGNGSSTFKGSGFVRGGIFDRIRVEQGLTTLMFTDHDYKNLSAVPAEGAPTFKEAALFVARDGMLDPGRPFDLVFLGSRFDSKGGFSREFHAFDASHRLPRALYALDGPDPDDAIWKQAWANTPGRTAATVAWLLAVVGVFAGRRWSTGRMARLQRLHTGYLAFAFLVGGLVLGLQPSVTQVLTFIGSLVHGWDLRLFLSDPLLFVGWIFIAATTLVWGRGVFCGWTCPYGALNELLFKLGRTLRLPDWELPDAVHTRLRWLRYAVFLGLVAAYLHDPILGEKAAEVEPFKSTFLVAPWTRAWGFAGWWLLLLGLSLVIYRPFCRYLCPLGAALAVPGSARISGPYRRDFCSKCTICTRGCEPRAIRKDGTIDPRECLSCMECEANWRDDQVCPPLVKLRRDRERAAK